MISLVELLKMQGVEFGKYKVHLATKSKKAPRNTPSPLEVYIGGTFKDWQEDQTRENFKCDSILALIHLGGDQWLFGGVYRILGVIKGTKTRFKYRTILAPNQDSLVGRVIVRYKRTSRMPYRLGHTLGGILEVAQVLDTPKSLEKFPGYNDVIISHAKLKLVVAKAEASWKAALSNVNGVYLIMDTKNGHKYVGIAYGSGGIWQRWCSYAKSGHGNNAELRALLKAEGDDHACNFQYSILEIADSHATKEQIQARESYWKRILLSRQFGYNAN